MNKDQQIEKVKPTPIPVTVVAGFLGAGKTTLINHILNGDHGRRIAVVVNDFGSINIDAELISDVGEGMVSLANGCICCVIRSDLISAVLQLADRPERPDHIVIESSGVADPASVVRAFMVPEIRSSVLLDGVITVVDADMAPLMCRRRSGSGAADRRWRPDRSEQDRSGDPEGSRRLAILDPPVQARGTGSSRPSHCSSAASRSCLACIRSIRELQQREKSI